MGGTGKQSMAGAMLMLADELANECIFKDDIRLKAKDFAGIILKEDEVSFGKPILKLNLIVEIEYDNYRKRPCFKIVNAESEIVKDDKKKKDKNIPF